MIRASESGHWYARDGTPVYEVPRAKGDGMRAATLADARKLGLFPGVTSIIKCAAAPGLEIWKSQQVLLSALTLPRVEGESNEALCSRIMADSGEQARKARDRGTEIHAAIQGHYEGKAPSEDMWPFVKGVSLMLLENCGEQDWVAEKPCANRMGYGTKADLHSHEWVIDFKGSDFDAGTVATLKTWDEHAMQLSATRAALSLPGAECAIVYVSRTTPGLCRLIRLNESELMRGWGMFCALLDYWQTKNNYHPHRALEAA